MGVSSFPEVSSGKAVGDDRTDELAGLRRRMAAMSGRPDRRSIEVRDPAVDVLRVPDAVSNLFPHKGIVRGTVTAFVGAHSMLTAIVAAVTGSGGQIGIVGMPRMGLLSAVEMGADLSRIATVPHPGADPVEVATVLLDGMDLVILGAPGGLEVAPARARVVMGRVRKQSSALMVVGGRWPGAHGQIDAEVLGYRRSPERSEIVDLAAARSGYGRIGGMRLRVTASGRGRRTESVEVDLSSRGVGPEKTLHMMPVSARPELAVAN